MNHLAAGETSDPATRRTVTPELLDTLPAEDPRARRSRLDLQRVNACMGNAGIVAGLIRDAAASHRLKRFAELGGGDGALMARVVQRLRGSVTDGVLTVVDQQRLLTPEMIERFGAAGWQATAVVADVFGWLETAKHVDAIIANLFLHHFDDGRLRELLARVSELTRVFIACEPRRISRPWAAGLLVGLLGCNSVTRHDATLSVRAGFTGRELCELWPRERGWRLEEREAGFFSHVFFARRS